MMLYLRIMREGFARQLAMDFIRTHIYTKAAVFRSINLIDVGGTESSHSVYGSGGF